MLYQDIKDDTIGIYMLSFFHQYSNPLGIKLSQFINKISSYCHLSMLET